MTYTKVQGKILRILKNSKIIKAKSVWKIVKKKNIGTHGKNILQNNHLYKFHKT